MTQAMAARLRQALELEAPVVAPGVFDPLTARIVAGLGFPAVYLGGLAMGLHLAVGQPFITLEEVAGIVLGWRQQLMFRLSLTPMLVSATLRTRAGPSLTWNAPALRPCRSMISLSQNARITT